MKQRLNFMLHKKFYLHNRFLTFITISFIPIAHPYYKWKSRLIGLECCKCKKRTDVVTFKIEGSLKKFFWLWIICPECYEKDIIIDNDII